ncbi:putative manganese efflux pump MntP [Paenibacillus radicis (ex Gao et al. 2016)]|uniref:Putative manganese efflux pump MntP n=2 Tax=Paenibacillus radicis (ex Gao et al. 2016) TaxID=1737354 RepID=A0A917HN37_9BACL|nr:manganese efflux pump MntP family protein [Paenibacillus radicis (ex Gao et al. 2016)]GGG85154.1 putative manganese efflux pump MntP [Paenibacillus radicis (ex Gao et al. 2016)]
MNEAALHAGQFATLLIMAVALGMDAFSLGIGIGLKGIRLRDILKLSSVIALFHIIMPLGGMFAGQFVSGLLGHVATTAAGILLVLLGGHMIYSSIKGEEVKSLDYRSVWGTFLFALSVSIDSFSVGVTLGMFQADLLLTILLFGFFGGLMSIMGLMLGRRVSRNLGGYGEAFGGAILFIFGIMFII